MMSKPTIPLYEVIEDLAETTGATRGLRTNAGQTEKSQLFKVIDAINDSTAEVPLSSAIFDALALKTDSTDMETGTWTPAYDSTVSGVVTGFSGGFESYYIKIVGSTYSIVIISSHIDVTTSGATGVGYIQVAGLPYTRTSGGSTTIDGTANGRDSDCFGSCSGYSNTSGVQLNINDVVGDSVKSLKVFAMYRTNQ